MANDLQGDIIRILEQAKAEIQANMQARQVNASGRTSASIRVEVYDGGVRLLGGYEGVHSIPNSPGIYGSDTAPIQTLEFGRKGGGVPKGLYYILREWSKEKGIRFASEQERGTFAYFLARKIAREGTARNKENKDIYSTPVEKAKAEVNKTVRATISNTFAAAFGAFKASNIRGAFTN